MTAATVVDELSEIFGAYFDYVGENESPQLYHRWAFISGISAIVGRDNYIPFGHGRIHGNMYTVLIGAAGTRKSTAIGQVTKLLKLAGYHNFAADRTSKEKFIADLQKLNERPRELADVLTADLDVLTDDKVPAELLIAADELQDFMGQSNLDYITMLGVLWDSKETYEHRTKNAKSSKIHKPYVSLLGGSTQTGFSAAFPPEIVTQGFLSRLLLIYGERTARRIAFPADNTHDSSELVELLKAVMLSKRGAVTLAPTAKKLATEIYNIDYTLHDVRFESYDQRRYTHMLKLALICAKMRGSCEIHEGDILVANTTLHYAEQRMTRALGEFGKSKNAEIAHTVHTVIMNAKAPLNINDIWRHVAADLTSQRELADVIKMLLTQEKIQSITTSAGSVFMANHRELKFQGEQYLLDNFISQAELNYEI